jgi:hypothetical protein
MSAAFKKKAAEEEVNEMSAAEKKVYLQRQIETTTHRIMMEEQKTSDSAAAMVELDSKLGELRDNYTTEEARALQLTKELNEAYEKMKEELSANIDGLHESIAINKDLLEQAREEKDETEKKKNQIIGLKDAEIAEQKRKMDEMAHEFAQMLKGTLDKMTEKIVITNEWATTQPGVKGPIVKSFEDFNFMKPEKRF